MHVADKNTVMHFWNCLKSHSGLKKKTEQNTQSNSNKINVSEHTRIRLSLFSEEGIMLWLGMMHSL